MAKLSKYNQKRNFNKTNEPIGKVQKSGKKLKFVVQHHIATKDHYDLRLEWDGVFVSFAIPKGPSYNPKDKRLAIKVEDHPLSYGNFEGNIPHGEYGAGTVMLWDKGYWEPINTPKNVFKNKVIKFRLKGKRLIGSWSLIQIDKNNYLMIKETSDNKKIININKYKISIKTGRTMNEIRNNITKIKDIEITNPDKIVFADINITKKDIYNYYRLVGKRMFPFLDNRLISTVRCPNGIDNECFYMKHLNTKSRNLGKKVLKDKTGEQGDYYYFKNVNGLLEEVQMNSYEFHIWGSKQAKVTKPDILAFDFDPDESLSLKNVRQGVRDLKAILDDLHLKAYLKTSGGKGYHVFVPINVPSYPKLEKNAKDIASLMVENWPEKYTLNMRKKNRKGKIFIDYFRNKYGSTSVCPYSLRIRKKASISFPISWNDLNKVKPDSFTIKNVKKYLKKKDPWKDFFTNNF